MLRRLKHYITHLPYYLSVAPAWLRSRRRQRKASDLLSPVDGFKDLPGYREVIGIGVFRHPEEIDPHLIPHYAGMGVSNLVLVFDDETLDASQIGSDLVQAGVDAEKTTVLIRPPGVAMQDLLSVLLNTRLKHRWSLIVMGNQYLYFPHCGTRTLADLCEFVQSERRSSLYGVELDLYRETFDRDGSVSPFDGAWFFDGAGYGQDAIQETHSVAFRGGLAARAGKLIGQSATRDRSRSMLLRSDGDVELLAGSGLAVRRKYNTANSEWHLSPTVCMASTRAYEELCERRSRVPSDIVDNPQDWLKSGHSHAFDARPTTFIDAGLMNRGQWF